LAAEGLGIVISPLTDYQKMNKIFVVMQVDECARKFVLIGRLLALHFGPLPRQCRLQADCSRSTNAYDRQLAT
jgi:hypothetical protein